MFAYKRDSVGTSLLNERNGRLWSGILRAMIQDTVKLKNRAMGAGIV